jgi:succinyl-CoA synthetase alpha subunit
VSILLDRETRVVVQGLTGREGSFHARIMRDYGTRIVAGVTPGKGGRDHESIPVFDTVAQARAATGAEAGIVFVPRVRAADSLVEAIRAGLRLVVCTADGIPAHDMLLVRAIAKEAGCTVVGPNCPGLISPGKSKLGFMPSHVHAAGPVGILSKSGSLSYEAAWELTRAGIGQSTVVGIGGDAVKGVGYTELLPLFAEDPETRLIVLLGEIGGEDEQLAAAWLSTHRIRKPVIAYLVGRSAPPSVRIGHPGTVFLRQGGGTGFDDKLDRLRQAGVEIVNNPWELAERAARALERVSRELWPGAAGWRKA